MGLSDGYRNLWTVPTNTEVFCAVYMTMREKQILARTIGGNNAFFRDNYIISNNYSEKP